MSSEPQLQKCPSCNRTLSTHSLTSLCEPCFRKMRISPSPATLPPNPVAGCEVIQYENRKAIEIAKDKSTLLIISVDSYQFSEQAAEQVIDYIAACLRKK